MCKHTSELRNSWLHYLNKHEGNNSGESSQTTEPNTEARFYKGPGQYVDVWREHLIENMGIMYLFSNIVYFIFLC